MSKCIRCGRCIEACPYVSLFAANDLEGAAVGTPILNMREKACQLCEDFPCVNVCPTDALSGIIKREDVDMGLAVVDEDTCLAMLGDRCEVCYSVCPLKGTAIVLDPRLREGDLIELCAVREENAVFRLLGHGALDDGLRLVGLGHAAFTVETLAADDGEVEKG